MVKKFNAGTSSFESYRLEVSPEFIKVKPTRKLLFFYAFFAMIGLGCILGWLPVKLESGEPLYPVIIFGSVFFLVGAGLMLFDCRRRYPCIDLRQRMFYPLGKRRNGADDFTSAISLAEAERLQVSANFSRSSDGSWVSYTLTLVYPGDERYLLLRHGSEAAIMRDAKLLAQYTGLLLLEDDSKKEIEKETQQNDVGSAVFLLLFGAFWSALSSFILWGALKSAEASVLDIILPGVFLLLGVVILWSAVKFLLKRIFCKKTSAYSMKQNQKKLEADRK